MAKLLVCNGDKCVEVTAEMVELLGMAAMDYTAKVVKTGGLLDGFQVLEGLGLVRRESEAFIGEQWHTVWFSISVQGLEVLERWQEVTQCGCA